MMKKKNCLYKRKTFPLIIIIRQKTFFFCIKPLEVFILTKDIGCLFRERTQEMYRLTSSISNNLYLVSDSEKKETYAHNF